MYDVTCPSEPAPRSRGGGPTHAAATNATDPLGAIRVAGGVDLKIARRGDQSFASRRVERDGYKLRVPNRPGVLEVAIVNTGGGIASGDRIAIDVEADDGTDAVVTSPAAERIYRANSLAPARYSTSLKVGDGASLLWLPQETIMFDGARIERTIDVTLGRDATLVIAETVIFGRKARGEVVSSGRFQDRWQIKRGGRLVHAEAVLLDGAISQTLDVAAVAGGAAAMSTVVVVGPQVDAALASTRAILGRQPVTSGVSRWDGKLVVRLLGRSGQDVRTALEQALPVLTGCALPRVWNC